jgi:hypothetical protein
MDNAVQTLHTCLAHAAYVGFRDYNYQDRNWGNYRKWREDVFDRLSQDQKKTLYEQERSTGVHMGPPDTKVEKTRKHTDYDMTVAAMFPQTWGSTALGFGGVGGQAITTAYVVIVKSNLTGEWAVYFGGRLAYVIARPNEVFYVHIHANTMVDANKGKATYEQTN